MNKILIVDDEETLCEALRFNLRAEGYEVDTALSAEDALALDLASYRLVLLDIMMGDISGTQLAQIMKRNPATAHVPIIFITARDADADMAAGLDLGADDYIAKPFSMVNVTARVRAVLRRTEGNAPAAPATDKCADVITFKGLSVCPTRKEVSVDGTIVKMPRKEYEILATLMSQPGCVFSRAELLSRIWPEEVVVLDRVVDVNITRLRSKIGPYAPCIVTRSGYGYGFIPPTES